jgi:AraC family transcriptional regulator
MDTAAARESAGARHPDRVVFETGLVAIGAFRCEIGNPMFQDSGPIDRPCFVFPRTAVAIEHEGARPFIADPTVMTLYNEGERYERHAVSPEGDRCDWFGVRPEILRDAVGAGDPAAAADPARVFRRSWAPASARLYLEQRRVFVAAASGSPIDPLELEERVLSLLHHVTGQVEPGAAPDDDPASRAARRRRSLVDEACRLLGQRFREPLTLADIASSLECSPFHLCRVFRGHTGVTIHRHLTELRLRAALELMELGQDLTSVALETGYSSHSHFTASFRDVFGVTPSRAIGRGRRRPSRNPIA